MSKVREFRPSLEKIEEEYTKDPIKDDDRMYKLKEIIENLDDLDKALLIVYADEESMAKTGKKFNVSPATIHSNIKRIRNIIKEKL
jgi:DNA-directed RNA polymerase specialized sigma24 family protein